MKENEAFAKRLVGNIRSLFVGHPRHSEKDFADTLALLWQFERKLDGGGGQTDGGWEPEICQWYFEARAFLDSGQTRKFSVHAQALREFILRGLGHEEISRPKHIQLSEGPLFFKQRGADLRKELAIISGALSKTFGQTVRLKAVSDRRLLNDPEWIERRRKIEEALALILKVWPALHDEMVCVIRAVCLVEGSKLISSSSRGYMGVVMMNSKKRWSMLIFLDHLIHEATHLLLFKKEEHNPFLKNPLKPGIPSPVRWDLRPLNGVFHATFVAYRVGLFFERLLAIKPSMEAYERYHCHLLEFYRGMEAVEKHARFTPEGKRFFGRLMRQYKSWKARIPTPDEEASSRGRPEGCQ